MIVRSQFDKDYDLLYKRMLALSGICLEQLTLFEKVCRKTKESYMEDGHDLLTQGMQQSRSCQHACQQILLLQHPVAGDMRKISAMENAFFDLQRMCSMLSEAIRQLYGLPVMDQEDILEPSIRTARIMIEKCVLDFGTDKSEADAVIKMDDQADDLFEKANDRCISIIESNPQSARGLIRVLMGAKYMERICDHCVSLARWSLYAKE